MKTMLFLMISSTALAGKYIVVEDKVRSIESQGSSERVTFRRNAGIYYLRSDAKKFTLLKEALTKSKKSGEAIRVKVEPLRLEIEDLDAH
jgi:hypothetical protein